MKKIQIVLPSSKTDQASLAPGTSKAADAQAVKPKIKIVPNEQNKIKLQTNSGNGVISDSGVLMLRRTSIVRKSTLATEAKQPNT